MDEPERPHESSENDDDVDGRLFPSGFFEIFGESYDSGERQKNEGIGGNNPPPTPPVPPSPPPTPPDESVYQRWWGGLTRERRIELGLTAAIVFLALAQLIVLISSNNSTTRQADRLIDAARYSAYASDRNAQAAQSFLGSAERINKGVGNAVDRLNEQATQLGYNVTQTERLASATEKANANVTASDRPWIGGIIAVGNFDVGKNPTVTITYINSGKRPAVVDFTGVHSDFFTAFPPSPRELYLTGQALKESPSKAVLVPGAATQMNYTADTAIIQPQWDLATRQPPILKYFVFTTAEYRDLVTNEPHYTQVCVVFYPASKSATDTGFRNCQEYNDAN